MLSCVVTFATQPQSSTLSASPLQLVQQSAPSLKNQAPLFSVVCACSYNRTVRLYRRNPCGISGFRTAVQKTGGGYPLRGTNSQFGMGHGAL